MSLKKRKLSHSSSSASRKFGGIAVPATKQAGLSPMKLMEASMKAVKVEMVRKSNEEARKEEEQASKAMKKEAMAKTLEKSRRFLARQDEKIAPIVTDVLPPQVRSAITNFYRFWTGSWQSYISICKPWI